MTGPVQGPTSVLTVSGEDANAAGLQRGAGRGLRGAGGYRSLHVHALQWNQSTPSALKTLPAEVMTCVRFIKP